MQETHTTSAEEEFTRAAMSVTDSCQSNSGQSRTDHTSDLLNRHDLTDLMSMEMLG